MSGHNDGGPAFPQMDAYVNAAGEKPVYVAAGGMTMRDYFADNAPIDYRAALDCWGADTPLSQDDATRASFFAVWAMLRYEWADAMLAARGDELRAILAHQPAPVVDEAMRKDAERYRWMRNPTSDVGLVIDKVTGEVPYHEGTHTGGYATYEYRAGDELDSAIDAALARVQGVES